VVTDAQNTIIKEFQNNPKVVAAVLQEGETAAWVNAFWTNHFLRDTVLWDANKQHTPNYKQPATGIPMGRGFIIDQEGKVAVPYFGYEPRETIRKIYDLIAFANFGKGCASTTTLPSISCAAKPKLGQTFTLDIRGFLPQRQGQLIIGASKTVWGTTPLPYSLAPLGAGNCSLWVSMDLPQGFVTDAQGNVRTSYQVPAWSSLLGLFFHGQAWAVDPQANAASIATSNAFEAVVGF
jgi:hypothetical protein